MQVNPENSRAMSALTCNWISCVLARHIRRTKIKDKLVFIVIFIPYCIFLEHLSGISGEFGGAMAPFQNTYGETKLL